jgi:hypothetical protein
MVNTEGGTDDEEFRVAALVDRVNTTFGIWMGTTIGCAQCHNHKYDPFTQREYYQLFAFFNQTKDKGRSNEPELELPSPDQAARREEVRAKIAPLEKILDTPASSLDQAQSLWEDDLAAAQEQVEASWTVLDVNELQATGGVTLSKLADGSVLAGGTLTDTNIYEMTAQLSLKGITAIRLEALTDDNLPHGSCGRSEDGDFVLTEFAVGVTPFDVNDPGGELKRTLSFETAYADCSMEKYGVKEAIDGKRTTGWSIAAYEPTNRVDHVAVFVNKDPLELGGVLRFRLHQESDRRQHLLGRFRLSVSTAPREAHLALAKLPDEVRRRLSTAPDDRSEPERVEVAKYFRTIAPEFDKVREQVAALHKEEPKDIPTTLVMEAMSTNRPTHILVRGSHLNQGEEVLPGTPAALHPWPEGQPTNRLGLARWLVSPANPLVGRVTMNRIWAQYFGRGLVETSEEFGAQGELPTHPGLLDWLATEFVERGWSLKAMHRLIVTSATYRQCSDVTPELAERDPFNRLLARGPRFRMEAEMLRDTALAASGLLNEKIGGPSVFPYQPDGVWNSPYNGDRWEMSKDGDQFRRGIYTFARRTAPYAAFAAFDAPSREVMCERRARSNTPIQALVTMNDPAFVAAANGLAERLMKDGGTTAEQRLEYAFECCVARRPEAAEARPLLRLYEESREKFSDDNGAARRLASVGLPKSDEDSHAVERAAWAVVSNVLLNLDEALTKD